MMATTVKRTSEEKILIAALKEFAQHGFEGARMDRIAKLAKVNKAMIYYHFKGKEALYEKILSNTIGGVYRRISAAIDESDGSDQQIFNVVGSYIDYLKSLDLDYFRLILRELSSGGKYLRKIALPNMIEPLMTKIARVVGKAVREKRIRGINPYYTFIHTVGGIVFFNSLRLSLEGTELYPILYREGYLDEFKRNLVEILKHGIEVKG